MIMMTLIEDFLKVLDVYDDFLKSLHEKILHVHVVYMVVKMS